MSEQDRLDPPPDDIDLTPEQCAEIERLGEISREGSLYELLGVPDGADAKTVQEAYYELSRHWHPDRFFRKELGEYGPMLETVFIAIAEAYRVLSDDARRTVYDMEQAGKGYRRKTPPTAPRPRKTEPAAPADAPVYEATLPRRPRRTETRSPRSPAPPDVDPSSDVDSASSGSDPARRRRRSRRKAFRTKGLAKVREEMVVRLKRARQCYIDGKAEFEAGNVVKASAALALATSYDPGNEEYARLNTEVQKAARRIQIQQFILAAENAETYRNVRAALENYRKAVSYEPDDGLPYYRLGMLIWRYEDDLRSAVQYLRQAALIDPDKVDFRMALGDAFVELDLKLNARREYQAVLDMDKSHAGAKEGMKRAR